MASLLLLDAARPMPRPDPLLIWLLLKRPPYARRNLIAGRWAHHPGVKSCVNPHTDY